MNNRPRWSYSQLSTYLRCPLQYRFQYILGMKRSFTPSSLALGSAVHEALAIYHRSIQDNSPLQPPVVKTAFVDAWKQRAFKETIHYSYRQEEKTILEQGIALVETYLQGQTPQNILAVEKELLVPLYNRNGEYLEKPLLAIMDLITQDTPTILITDFKTSSKAYSELEASTSLQATCYVHAANEVFGELARFEYSVLIKTKTPRLQHVEVSRTTTDFGRLGDLVQTVDRAIEAQIFYPVETPLNCSTCCFRKPCLEWGTQPEANNAAMMTTLDAKKEEENEVYKPSPVMVNQA